MSFTNFVDRWNNRWSKIQSGFEKQVFFRRKYKLTSNAYRNDVSDTFMILKDQMKKKTKVKK